MHDELIKRLHKRIALTTAGSPLQDDLREAADALERVPKWIPVTERLPEEDGFTLIFTAHGHAGVCYFTNGWWGGYGMDGITHWMPLPQSPKEGT